MKTLVISSRVYGELQFFLDEADFEKYKNWILYANRYSSGFYLMGYPRGGRLQTRLMHREIMGAQKGEVIDHIDRNTTNNTRGNLRRATQTENGMNRGKNKNGRTSKFKGVSWQKERKKWVAAITINGVMKNLGRFDSEKDAAIAYNTALDANGILSPRNAI